jgi:hypothetical protein
MESVENAYKRRVEGGTWKLMLEGKVNEEIAALKAMVEANNAEIEALKATNNGRNGGAQDKASKRAARAAKYAWQKVPPASNATTTKVFEDRVYHWCGTHKAWTMHTPAECKGVDFKKNGSGNNTNNGNNNSENQPQAMVSMSATNTPVVEVNEAYQTLVQYCDGCEEDCY